MIYGLSAAYLTALVASLLMKWRRGEELDMVPSICWAALIVVPFTVQIPYFSPRYLGIQAAGTFLVASALLIGDALPPWRGLVRRTSLRAIGSASFERRFCYAAAVAVLILPLAHLVLMPRIPLVDRMAYELSDKTAVKGIQEAAQRLSDLRSTLAVRLEQSPGEAVEAYLAALATAAKAEGEMQSRLSSLAADEPEAGVLEIYSDYVARLASSRQSELDLVQTFQEEGRPVTPAQAGGYRQALAEVDRTQQALAAEFEKRIADQVERNLARGREAASKLLPVPRLFTYACESAMLLAPVVVLLLLRNRGFLGAALLLGATFVYSKATLARGPLLGLALLCGCLGWAFIPTRFRRVSGLVAVAGTLAIAAGFTWYLTRNPLSIVNFRVPSEVQAANLGHAPDSFGKGEMTFTLADHNRMLELAKTIPEFKDAPEPSTIPKAVNYVSYRAFLVPVEVSQRWYTYFPDVFGAYFGFAGLIPGSTATPGYKHPSNLVGVWAYQSRFPTHYLGSVHAYASADADAYARWGMVGVICLAAVLLFGRWLLKVLRSDSFVSTCLYLSAVLSLGMNLPAASLQAIMAAHGLLLFVLLLGLTSLTWSPRKP